MAPLKPHRRELFCRAVITAAKLGKSQGWAYTEAGYSAGEMSAHANASRLLKNDSIKGRIAELGAPAVKRTQVSVESLLNELETTIKDARAAKQHNTVVQALTLSAKLVGLLREKIDVSVEVGGTREEILDRLEQRHGSEAMAVLRAALDNSDYTKPMIEKRERHAIETTGRSEADIALEDFCPRK
jgi:phage terminase small subunit